MGNTLSIIACLLLLSACGGGGTSSPSPITPGPITPPNSNEVPALITGNGYIIIGDHNVITNQSVGFGILAEQDESFTSILWQQLSGPEVSILAPNSSVIGFDAVTAGQYQFNVAATTTSGAQINQTISLTVQESSQDIANVRLDHATMETANVSLRVDGDSREIESINWTQTAGPSVNNIDQQDNYLFFTAPSVLADQAITFRATVTYTDGQQAIDDSFLIVRNAQVSDEGYFPYYSDQIVTTDMYAYVNNSPYKTALESCVYNNLVDRSCSFSNLPLLGQEYSNPTIDEVLQRLLVSHKWMGDRFKQYLQQSQASADMLNLLRATTAIVISYDVRPSFYWSATGAIYLDANNFWITPQERDTLNDQPDYRSDFGEDLQFSIPWRYVKNNDYYFTRDNFLPQDRLTRTFEDMESTVSWLMYHELGHANDFFPPNRWSSITLSASPLSYSNDNSPSSSVFSAIYPLNSSQMLSLADVRFKGQAVSASQQNLLPTDITQLFTPDTAPAFYSYVTEREDYALLFERFMMAYRYGVEADVAIIDKDDLIVDWGQRSRISSETIRPRVEYVVEQIFPDLNVNQIQQTLPAPKLMTPGLDWYDNLDLSSSQKQAKGKAKTQGKRRNITEDLTRPHKRFFTRPQR